MIGPLHLAQVTTHIGYSPLCFCCCDVEEADNVENMGGDSFTVAPKPLVESYIVAQAKAKAQARKIAAKQAGTIATPLTKLPKPQPDRQNSELRHKSGNKSRGPDIRGDDWGVRYLEIKETSLRLFEEDVTLLTVMIIDAEFKRNRSFNTVSVEKT